MKTSTQSVETVISKRIAELRAQAGKTQEDIATAAKAVGLKWSRSTVAQIESGARNLSVNSFLLLPMILTNALARQVTLEEILTNKESVQLSPEILVHPGALPKGLSGVLRDPSDYMRVTKSLEIGREMALARRLHLSRQETRDLVNDAASEPVVQIARKLRKKPVDIALAARKLWGRSLVEERDRRIAEQNPEPRRLQALRGHTSRQLIKDLENTLKERR